MSLQLISMKTLFDKFEVDCPSWLEDTELEGDWLNSEYTFENNKHKWEFQETYQGYVVRHLVLVFDDEECSLNAFIDGDIHLLEFWDEEGHFVT